MNKQELIEAIAQKRHINKPVLEMACDEIFAAIVEAVAAGKTVEVPEFGIFYRSEQHLGRTRVPSTKKIPVFSPNASFRMAERDSETEVMNDL